MMRSKTVQPLHDSGMNTLSVATSLAARLVPTLVCVAVAAGFSARAQGAPQTAPRIVILGDSLTSGRGIGKALAYPAVLQARLKENGYNYDVVNAGVSGDTTAGGRARLDWALGDGADAAVVELGGNDGLRGVNPDATAANLSAILDTLAAKHIPVLLSGMLAPPNLGPDYWDAFRAVFTRLGQRPGVIFDPFFLQGVAARPELNQPDRLHPNAEGVKIIVARMLPLMQQLVAQVPQ